MLDIDCVELLKVLAPIIATLVTAILQWKANNKHAAKQSILQMIMEDEFNYHTFGELPKNQVRIHEEYEVYHKNGGNGIITSKVASYDDWINSIEKNIKKNHR